MSDFLDLNKKYITAKKFLKDQILQCEIKPGQKIPSEHELAQQLNVSRHTIRRAISELVAEGYLITEHGKGTYCRIIQSTRSNTKIIGVITTYISEYIFPRVIEGIERVLSEKGYGMILKNTLNDPEKESQYLQEMFDKNVEGLIIEPAKSSLVPKNLSYFKAFENRRVPYVFIHGWYEKMEDKPMVIVDDEKGMFEAVDYLAKKGKRKIAGIFKVDDIQGINRHKGYVKALMNNGIAYDPDLVVWFHSEDKYLKCSYGVQKLFGSSQKPDSVACYNDEIAVWVIKELNDMNLAVPQDVSVTGFDDSFLASSAVANLTTIKHPKDLLGEHAARMVLELINEQDPVENGSAKDISTKVIFKPEIVIRGTA
mgnify:FL=1